MIFTWVLTMQGVPQMVGNFFLALNMPKVGVTLMLVVMILLIGTFIDVSLN